MTDIVSIERIALIHAWAHLAQPWDQSLYTDNGGLVYVIRLPEYKRTDGQLAPEFAMLVKKELTAEDIEQFVATIQQFNGEQVAQSTPDKSIN